MKNGRIMVINSEKLETRVALLNDGLLEEYQVERKNHENIVGSLFMGRIVNIEPSLRAVFIDIGLDKNAFAHFEDMLPAGHQDLADKFDSCDDESRQSPPRMRPDDVPKHFPVGSKVLVQVTKGPIGTKGSRVTSDVSIAGRYLVFLPFSDNVGVSRKIEDAKERERLKKIMSKLDLPKGMGCICRTVGEDRKAVYFKRDLDMLLSGWKGVEKARSSGRCPCLVFKEPNLLEKSLRDSLTEDIDEIVIDDPKDYDYVKGFVSQVVDEDDSPLAVVLHQKAEPIFEYYKVEKQISGIFDRVAPLPSGGYICVDETEALVAIDVNSGGNRSAANKNETFLNTNLEAADEAARQLRLRNVGGLVVIDFIDMNSQKDREAVLKRMRAKVKNDRAKTKILPISQLGLMQMTRQRESESLLATVYDPCPYCQGRGKVKTPLSVSVEIQRDLKELLKRKRWDKGLAVRVIMHPSILARLKNEDSQFLAELETQYGKDMSFRGDPGLHIEDFKLVDPNTAEEFKL